MYVAEAGVGYLESFFLRLWSTEPEVQGAGFMELKGGSPRLARSMDDDIYLV